MTTEKLSGRSRTSWAAIVLTAVAVLFTGVVFWQNPVAEGQEKLRDITISEILKLPAGKIIAEGKDFSQGKYKITGYSVEEVPLTEKSKFKAAGKVVETEKVWRIKVDGGPFPVRAMPPTLFIGDKFVGNGIESEDLRSVTFILADVSLLVEGSALSFTYGKLGVGRQELSEKLNIRKEEEKQ